jgi:peptidoglycan/LPS O-acetylase OafA/YrhL
MNVPYVQSSDAAIHAVEPETTVKLKTRASKVAGFDALRAMAAFGVVLLHCCVPYMQPAVPGLVWSIRDTPDFFVAQCFWTIELFIMPLFLVLAGFLAWTSIERGGRVSLIRSRARRLLGPLLFGMVVILPLDLYAWLLGWVSEGLIPAQKLRSLKFDGGVDRDLWGLSHLWFLQYLFLYVVTLAAANWAWHRMPATIRRSIHPAWASAFLVLVGCVTLYVRPEVVWGFQHRFLPVPSKWIYSGVFFALGVLLARFDPNLEWLKIRASRLVAPSLAFVLAALCLGNWHLRGGSNELASMTLAVATCLSATMVTLTIIGSAAKRISRVPPIVGYLAAASFWVYMVHHPILGLVHIDLKWMLPSWSPALKVALAFSVTLLCSLATYEVWVRQTSLGRLLGLQWQIPRSRRAATESVGGDDVISIDADRDFDEQTGSISPRRAA